MKNWQSRLMAFFSIALITGFCLINATAQRPNPTQQQTDEWRRKGPCNDPWVSMAVAQANASVRLAHGAGNYGECNVSQYNGGQWNSYDQLFKAVEKVRDDMRANGTEWDSYDIRNVGKAVIFLAPDKTAAEAKILSHNGGTLISNINDVVAKLVAAGGGNVVPTGGGSFLNKLKEAKLVGNDGASLVAAGGMNMQKVIASFAARPMEIIVIDPSKFNLQTAGTKKYYKVGSVYYVWK